MRAKSMMRVLGACVAGALAAAAFVACSGDDTTTTTPPHDGGLDSTTQPGVDAGIDSNMPTMPVDAAIDTNMPPPVDAGMDTSLPVDSGVDAPPPINCDAGPATHMVTVGPQGNIVFAPNALTICKGDTVTWTWGSTGHSVTSGANCTADSVFCSPNDTNCAAGTTSSSGVMYSHTFAASGSFPYFCSPHCASGMTGTITVQ
jgi:plastocyanin